jgi:hypothetical protein
MKASLPFVSNVVTDGRGAWPELIFGQGDGQQVRRNKIEPR